MTGRNLHRIAGALDRLQRKAATGNCQIDSCGNPAVGYIQGTAGRPAGVCAQHAEIAPRYGYTVYQPDTDTGATSVRSEALGWESAPEYHAQCEPSS